jgi:hypothetical protein
MTADCGTSGTLVRKQPSEVRGHLRSNRTGSSNAIPVGVYRHSGHGHDRKFDLAAGTRPGHGGKGILACFSGAVDA